MKKFMVVLFSLLASNAYAQIAYLNPGSNSGVISVAIGNSFRTRILPNRSVYCKTKNSLLNFDISFSSIIATPFIAGDSGITGSLVGDAEAGVESDRGFNDAIAFIANEVVGEASGSYAYDITFSGVTPSPSNVTIQCFETTLYGNFNTVTVANPFNFLELSNDSNKDLTARIRVLKNDGTALATNDITVSANQQKDIAIHDIAGAANTFGRLQIAHNGGLHALRAKITKYTSSFLITASDKLETRENEQ